MSLRRFFPSTVGGIGINYKGLLDAHESNIYRAYGMVDFFTSYSGPCVRVSTSNSLDVAGTETDIFFQNGVINESQLLSAALGGSLYIQTFYDLSGNGRHVSASAGGSLRRRARIVNSGVIEKYNGKPSPIYQLNEIAYSFAGDMLPLSTPSTAIYVHDLVKTGQSIKFGVPSNSSSQFSFVSQSGSTSTLISGSAMPGNTLRANKISFSGTTRNNVYDFLSGKKIVSEFNFSLNNAINWHFPNYGSTNSGSFLNGFLPSMLLWNANLTTTSIDAIMDLLNSYYTVY